jgi:uncharacterized repeat protein (TIGR01451 family)
MMTVLSRAVQSLLAAALLAVGFGAPAEAQNNGARIISNVAFLHWDTQAGEMTRASNQVNIAVAIPDLLLDTQRAIDGVTPGLLQASCEAGDQSAAAGQVSNPLATLSTVHTDSLRPGQPLVLSLIRPTANRSPDAIDSFSVLLKSSTGDVERVTFYESGKDSGRFSAVIATQAMPPAAIPHNCRLSVERNSPLKLDLSDPDTSGPFVSGSVQILVDPFGMAFDSRDGTPVSEVKITLIDVSTGLPAQVFGDDGMSSYPSTVLSGQTVTDSGGNIYTFGPGDYRFPLVRPGTYRLIVEPVSPYTFPSTVSETELATLRRPDGEAFEIVPGSYGQLIRLTEPNPVRVDIPLDRPRTALVLAKMASRADAMIGDFVQYRVKVRNSGASAADPVTVTDRIPDQMRYRAGSARLNSAKAPDPEQGTDRILLFNLGKLLPGGEASLTYILEVRPNASAGDALNSAQASASGGLTSNVADANVRIIRDQLSDRLTVVGRIVAGRCSADPKSLRGVGGIRVMLEDGSYAVTDRDGRYHFEGLATGTHVVQVDRATLGPWTTTDCGNDVRSGGRSFSRFVDGHGGALKRVDFFLQPAGEIQLGGASKRRPKPLGDSAAAGGDTDFLAGQTPGADWVFPAIDYNPRAPVTRVVVKHGPGQTVRLFVDGKAADPITFDGTRKDAAGTVAISQWRGIPLQQRRTQLRAEIVDPSGTVAKTIERPVIFSDVAARAELLKDRSVLIADGIHRPVIALRLLDREGRPVHQGAAGSFDLPSPYLAAMEADAQQARQLAGLERARPTWRVEGDDGVAYVELEPTTASGSVTFRLSFQDGDHVREQRLEAWLDPGERPWTIVGLAEGTVGFDRLDKNMERLASSDDKTLEDGRLALYATGRIQGRWLLTLAYDSDKKKDDTRFGGVIDPQAYYTIYADRSERRYDASSVRKLYLRLERPQFYALFGDFDTGIDEPELTRYVRSLNGAKAEYRSDRVSLSAFAAKTPLRHRRDEIQGNGLSGPYLLGSRDILANSERISIEVRDRLRSDRIVQTRLLSRHIDYDIDYAAGTLLFREPILSRTSALDPQFIVADYEVDGTAREVLNAGGRVSVRTAKEQLQIAATAVHDSDGDRTTNLAGLDARLRLGATTEIRAEAAASRSEGNTSKAWLVEAEHHDSNVDVIAYAQQRDPGFGVGQINRAETGTRKIGLDGRFRFNDRMSLTGSAWHEEYLGRDTRRLAGRALLEYRTPELNARAGLTFARDHLSDGVDSRSTLLELGASRYFLGNRLELDAQTQFAISGQDGSADFPARHQLSTRFKVNRDVSLVGAYEISKGDAVNARTARLGFDLAPWAGSRIALSGNVQDIAELGRRSFAAFGLSQSVVLSKNLSVDFTFDGNRTIGGIDPNRVINPLHPVASGGYVGDGSLLTEDFAAVTAGATYRTKLWTVTGRAEYRDGAREDRRGLILSALRQIGDGQAFGGALDWFRASAENGARSEVKTARISWADRPAGSSWSFLDKLELRGDRVDNAVSGSPGPLGSPLLLTGDARSLRVVNSLAVNYSDAPNRRELSLFWGSRWVSERFGSDDVSGWSNLLAADARISIGTMFELGAAASLRQSAGGKALAWSAGPQIGMKPLTNGWVMIGWNFNGYADRDFEADRYTRDGPYLSLRLKFDELSFAGLGFERLH